MVGWRPAPAVEDEVEPEPELGAEVVAGLQDVLDRHLGQVRVLAGGEPRRHRPRHRPRFLRCAERQTRLLHCEPVDVAVEQGEGTA